MRPDLRRHPSPPLRFGFAGQAYPLPHSGEAEGVRLRKAGPAPPPERGRIKERAVSAGLTKKQKFRPPAAGCRGRNYQHDEVSRSLLLWGGGS